MATITTGILTKTANITYELNHIYASLNDEKEQRLDTGHWSDIAKLCNKHKCYSILVMTNTSVPVNYKEILSFTDLSEEYGINTDYRIAWVELNIDAYNSIRTVQTLLSANGIPCRIFQDISGAKKWLFYGE